MTRIQFYARLSDLARLGDSIHFNKIIEIVTLCLMIIGTFLREITGEGYICAVFSYRFRNNDYTCLQCVQTEAGSFNNEDNLHQLRTCRFDDVIVTIKYPVFIATDTYRSYRALRSRFNCRTDITREIGWNTLDINTHDNAGV